MPSKESKIGQIWIERHLNKQTSIHLVLGLEGTARYRILNLETGEEAFLLVDALDHPFHARTWERMT